MELWALCVLRGMPFHCLMEHMILSPPTYPLASEIIPSSSEALKKSLFSKVEDGAVCFQARVSVTWMHCMLTGTISRAAVP